MMFVTQGGVPPHALCLKGKQPVCELECDALHAPLACCIVQVVQCYVQVGRSAGT